MYVVFLRISISVVTDDIVVFDGDNQAQPIAKSARTAHRFSATSVASADAVMAPSRRSARSAAAGGSEKRSASPLPFGKYAHTSRFAIIDSHSRL